jgi:hypothetical protein
MDWSAVTPGRFASGDCRKHIYVWEPQQVRLGNVACWNLDVTPGAVLVELLYRGYSLGCCCAGGQVGGRQGSVQGPHGLCGGHTVEPLGGQCMSDGCGPLSARAGRYVIPLLR